MHLEVPPPHLVVWNITKVGAENSNVYSRGRASNKRKGSVGWASDEMEEINLMK